MVKYVNALIFNLWNWDLWQESILLIWFNILLRLCFIKLKLLLLAIEVKSEEAGGDPKIIINPHLSKIPANSVGFFITQSAEEAKRSEALPLSLSPAFWTESV